MIKKTLLLSFIIFITFSCGNKGGRYANLHPLTLGMVMPSPDYYLPIETFGDSTGLQIDIVCFETVAARDSALYNGTIDGTALYYTDAIQMQENGIPVQITATYNADYHLIAGIGKGIRSVDQLAKKNIAIEKNTVTEYIADRLLAQAGISPETGINKVDIKKASLRLKLLQNGLVDATVLPGPHARSAVEEGNHSLTSLEESGISVAGFAFTEQALKEKKHEIELFIKEQDKASPLSNNEIESTIEWLKQKNN